jgi:hypothetical protein
VARAHQPLHQQFAEKAGPSEHQYILVHVISLTYRVYFLLSSKNHQTRKNQPLNKKNLRMVCP